MVINFGKYIAENNLLNEELLDVYRLVGKWLVEIRFSKFVIKFLNWYIIFFIKMCLFLRYFFWNLM